MSAEVIDAVGLMRVLGTIALKEPSLESRIARCACGAVATSSWELQAFRYTGSGSENATRYCVLCGDEIDEHFGPYDHGFAPVGPAHHDHFDCGHAVGDCA